jgi:hypothetical protein
MILKMYDGSESYVNESDGERIAEAINKGVKLLDLRRLSMGWVAPGAISKIEPGGTDPNVRHIAPPSRLDAPFNQEKAEKNLAWLREQLENKGILPKSRT